MSKTLVLTLAVAGLAGVVWALSEMVRKGQAAGAKRVAAVAGTGVALMLAPVVLVVAWVLKARQPQGRRVLQRKEQKDKLTRWELTGSQGSRQLVEVRTVPAASMTVVEVGVLARMVADMPRLKNLLRAMVGLKQVPVPEWNAVKAWEQAEKKRKQGPEKQGQQSQQNGQKQGQKPQQNGQKQGQKQGQKPQQNVQKQGQKPQQNGQGRPQNGQKPAAKPDGDVQAVAREMQEQRRLAAAR
jgi:hypothetical protein